MQHVPTPNSGGAYGSPIDGPLDTCTAKLPRAHRKYNFALVEMHYVVRLGEGGQEQEGNRGGGCTRNVYLCGSACVHD